jgi:hypothetical protein
MWLTGRTLGEGGVTTKLVGFGTLGIRLGLVIIYGALNIL